MEVYNHPQHQDILVIRASTGMSDAEASRFVDDMFHRIDGGTARIIFDCSNTNYLSSFEIGVLVHIHSRLRMKGGEIKIAGSHGLVAEVLQITHMDQIFDMHADLESAASAFDSD